MLARPAFGGSRSIADAVDVYGDMSPTGKTIYPPRPLVIHRTVSRVGRAADRRSALSAVRFPLKRFPNISPSDEHIQLTGASEIWNGRGSQNNGNREIQGRTAFDSHAACEQQLKRVGRERVRRAMNNDKKRFIWLISRAFNRSDDAGKGECNPKVCGVLKG